MLDSISLFVSVVRQGSFSAAAKQHGLSAATLTRRIQKLEEQLNVALLSRSSQGIRLTQPGQRLFDASVLQINDLQQQINHFQADTSHEQGRIHLLAPVNLTQTILQPILGRFISRFPSIQLSMLLSNQLDHLASSRADLAIRTGAMPNANLRQRKLGKVSTILVAPPEVAKTIASDANPEVLLQLPLVSAMSENRLKLYAVHSSNMLEFSIEPRFYANDLQVALAMLDACQGVMLCPVSELITHLEQGKLVRILPDWRGETRPIYAVWNEQNILLPRTRALLEFLVEELSPIPELQGVPR